MPQTDGVEPFEVLARGLCDYLERGDLDRASIHRLLNVVETAAQALPDVEPSSTDYADPVDLDDACRSVVGRVGTLFGDGCFYELDQQSVGDLRDDLSDIYRDLRRGLAIADKSVTDAVWAWRFSHEVRWGFHARDALAAIGALDDG